MYKIVVVALLLLLAGCAAPLQKATPSAQVNSDLNEVAIELNKVVRYNAKVLLPPLNLTEYKDVTFGIVDQNGTKYVTMTYPDYVKLISLLKVVEGRIEVQHSQIEEILNFYGKQLDRKEVD